MAPKQSHLNEGSKDAFRFLDAMVKRHPANGERSGAEGPMNPIEDRSKRPDKPRSEDEDSMKHSSIVKSEIGTVAVETPFEGRRREKNGQAGGRVPSRRRLPGRRDRLSHADSDEKPRKPCRQEAGNEQGDAASYNQPPNQLQHAMPSKSARFYQNVELEETTSDAAGADDSHMGGPRGAKYNTFTFVVGSARHKGDAEEVSDMQERSSRIGC